jgi:hypothetical protein
MIALHGDVVGFSYDRASLESTAWSSPADPDGESIATNSTLPPTAKRS